MGSDPVALFVVVANANSPAESSQNAATFSPPESPPIHPLSPDVSAIVPEENPNPMIESLISKFVVLIVVVVPSTIKSPEIATSPPMITSFITLNPELPVIDKLLN